MFSRSGNSEYPCLFPCLKGYAFSVSLVSMVFGVNLFGIFYQTIEIPFYPEFAELFFVNHEWMLLFIKGFFFVY